MPLDSMFAHPKRTAAALVGGLVLLVLGRGLWLARYEPVTSDRYAWGAFHVHSTMSDGLKPLSGIADEANRARVSFVLMSDHGAPHPEASVLDETVDGVRFIGGSEVGVPEGHLIVSNVASVPQYALPPFPPDAVGDVAAWGGFTVVTYPEDPTHRWQYWEDDFAPDGIEIINVTSYFRASSHWQKLMWALFSVFNRYYYVSGFEAPVYALERWDQLLTRGAVVPLFAANAHGGFLVTDDRNVGVPSYETVFSFVGLGIERSLAEDPARAIRRGEFFAVVRGAGEPDRFEFDIDARSTARVRLEARAGVPRIVLKRDGAVVAESGETELVFDAAAPGVYRVEVYLENHALLAPDVPWILSSAIFSGMEVPKPGRMRMECDAVGPIGLDGLHVEKDDESTASLETGAAGELVLDYHLSKATEDNVNRWVALSSRRPMDLSAFRGLYVRGEAPEPMRYWVEVRSGIDSYYASVKLTPAADASTIPWTAFYRTGGGREKPPLVAIDALFVTVNTSNTRTGFSSTLTLHELGGCR